MCTKSLMHFTEKFRWKHIYPTVSLFPIHTYSTCHNLSYLTLPLEGEFVYSCLLVLLLMTIFLLLTNVLTRRQF